MAANKQLTLAGVDVGAIELSSESPGTLQLWSMCSFDDSTDVAFKIKVNNPDVIKTTPSSGLLPRDGSAVDIRVDGVNVPTFEEEGKLKLLLVLTAVEGPRAGCEERAKLPCVWVTDAATTTAAAVQPQQPDTPSDAASPVMSSSAAPSPTDAGGDSRSELREGAPFDVALSVGSAECSKLLCGKFYRLEWKRSSRGETLPPEQCTQDGVINFRTESGSFFIPGCNVTYKGDGSAARRLLQLSVVDDSNGSVIGSTRFDSSECDEGERSADVPFRGDPSSQFIDVCLSMHFSSSSSPVDTATEAKAAGSRPAPPSSQPPPRAQQEDSQAPQQATPTTSASAPGSTGQQGRGMGISEEEPPASPSAADEISQRVKARAAPRKPPPKVPPPSNAAVTSGSTGSRQGPLSSGPGGAADDGTHNPIGDFRSEDEKPLSATETNVGVFVRVRPLLPHLNEGKPCWRIREDGASLQDKEQHLYTVDGVFPPDTRNSEVFSKLGAKLIDGLVSGINGTLFMYGQTASGKTHTVFGTNGEEGMTAMILRSLFQSVRSSSSAANTQIAVSYYEIYNEELNDLLDAGKSNVSIKTGKGGMFFADVKSVRIASADEGLRVLANGTENKHMGQSVLNDRSSRSHSIFQLKVMKKSSTQDGQTRTLSAELNLVDLAGSETLSEKGDAGQRKETSHINLSLTYLKKVIKELADNSTFVSYRNSSLTKILKQSLGGNSRTVLVCCVTASERHVRDTRNTLIFGTTAKTVTTTVSVNQRMSDRGSLAFRQEVLRLRQELEVAQDALRYYEGVEEDLKQAQSDNVTLLTLLDESNSALSSAKALHPKLGDTHQQQRDEVAEEVVEEGGASAPPHSTTAATRRGLQHPKPSPAGGEATDAVDDLFEDVEEIVDDGGGEERSPHPAKKSTTAATAQHVDPTTSGRRSGTQDEDFEDVEEVSERSPSVPKERSDAPPTAVSAKRHPPAPAAGKGRSGTTVEEVQRLRQQLIQLRMGHREELLAKEAQLRDAASQQVKASDEVATVIEKEEKISNLLTEIHRFLFYGTAVTVIVDDGKKSKVENRWLAFVKNAKGEMSIAIYAVQEAAHPPAPTNAEGGSSTSKQCNLSQLQPDREKLIEKHHLSDCKRVLLGQSDEYFGSVLNDLKRKQEEEEERGAASSTSPNAAAVLKRARVSFSMVFRKKKILNIATKDTSDFEAWVIDLNRELKIKAQWWQPMDVAQFPDHMKLSNEEKEFCGEMHLYPSEFLRAKERIAERRDRFITLFDVRSLCRLDLYHSQRFFHFLRCEGQVSQASLFFLTDRFADGMYVDEDEEEEVMDEVVEEEEEAKELKHEATTVLDAPPVSVTAGDGTVDEGSS